MMKMSHRINRNIINICFKLNLKKKGEKISMKIISTVKVLENGCVQLPKEMMEHLLLKQEIP